MNEKDLINFEEEIKQLYLDKKIRGPIHLSVGSEKPLIKIFRKIKKDDWVFSTYRSHYHALLKGIDKNWLKNEILEGRSMHIFNKEYKFFTSSIVAGALPIAVGVALALKWKKSKNRVWVFIGDMCAETGIFSECLKYATRNNLPIIFIIEDNQFCIDTPTQEVWGKSKSKSRIIRYRYKRIYPHSGVGQWIVF